MLKYRKHVQAPALIPLLAVASVWAGEKADLSRLIVVGDSLSAGYQNGSLLDAQQVNGYAARIAGQARVELPLPLIAAPGVPSVLQLINPGPPPVILPVEGSSEGRTNPTVQTMNLAVPGHMVRDSLETRPSLPFDSMTDLVLGLPGLLGGIANSQVEWAENLMPTTVICWVGNNDTLGAATEGTTVLLTPVDDFAAQYRTVLDRLQATGARLVVANIPDVSVVPYLTSAEAVAGMIGAPLEVVGPVLGIGPGDFVTPVAFEMILKILGGAMAGPLPDNAVLDKDELASVRWATDAYNDVIAREAARHHAALVDVHALTSRIHQRGYTVGGVRLTTGFLGGIFSLDGIHPTNTGYAIIANEFIHELNTQFAAGIPPVPIEQVYKDDPLVPRAEGPVQHGLGHISEGTVKSLRKMLVH